MSKHKHILDQIQTTFKTFGNGQETLMGNPDIQSMQDGPLIFALGVDVSDVVELVLRESGQYQVGFEAGLREYAWWKDGVQYVGSCGTTLKQALAEKP